MPAVCARASPDRVSRRSPPPPGGGSWPGGRLDGAGTRRHRPHATPSEPVLVRSRLADVRRPAPRLDWPRLSTAATFICGAAVLGMLHFASEERADSLAAVIAVVGAPSGSESQPGTAQQFYPGPQRPEGRHRQRRAREGCLRDGSGAGPVGRRVARGPRSISPSSPTTTTVSSSWICSTRSRASVSAPAQFGGAPVAVNLVWLVAQTTVRAKITS